MAQLKLESIYQCFSVLAGGVGLLNCLKIVQSSGRVLAVTVEKFLLKIFSFEMKVCV